MARVKCRKRSVITDRQSFSTLHSTSFGQQRPADLAFGGDALQISKKYFSMIIKKISFCPRSRSGLSPSVFGLLELIDCSLKKSSIRSLND